MRPGQEQDLPVMCLLKAGNSIIDGGVIVELLNRAVWANHEVDIARIVACSLLTRLPGLL